MDIEGFEKVKGERRIGNIIEYYAYIKCKIIEENFEVFDKVINGIKENILLLVNNSEQKLEIKSEVLAQPIKIYVNKKKLDFLDKKIREIKEIIISKSRNKIVTIYIYVNDYDRMFPNHQEN